MNKNYKGNFKDIDPILYEGGAHFKYKDLYNKLLQIQPHFINSNEENENEKIIIALKKREKIDYEHFFSNLNSNNEDNNIIFHYKNKNSERIPHLSNFIQKDLINDYINMKKKKLNHKIKFNFMQNKIQKS